MLNLTFDLTKKTEKKFKKILALYTNKEIFAQNIIDYQTSELRNGIINMQIDLKKFEDKYRLSTKKFYGQFESGQLGDNDDYIIWAGVYEMLLDNKKRLEELE